MDVRITIWVLILGLISSCTAFKPVGSVSNTAPSVRNNKVKFKEDVSVRQKVVAEALSCTGIRYRYGGTNKSGYDCSGLVYSVYSANDIQVPRKAADMSEIGRKVIPSRAKKGDLIFFALRGKADHVAIVTEDAQNGSLWVVHSTSSRGVLHEDVMESSYWSRRIREARDVID